MRHDAHRALVVALADHLGPLDDLVSKTRDWSSATFTGMRHELSFTITAGDASARLATAIGEADLPMKGHFVGDIAVISVKRDGYVFRVTLEALTIEDV